VSLPVPLDVADLVARELRRLLTGQPGEIAAGVKVSTETGRGHDGGPPSVPWMLVSEDGHGWSWPAVQHATIRLTCWHRNPHAAKALAALALGLLCTVRGSGALIAAEPVTAPLAALDPLTRAPLAFTTALVHARTPAVR
jgi:hypothetical protein